MKIVLNLFFLTLTVTIALVLNYSDLRKGLVGFDNRASESSYIYYFNSEDMKFTTNAQKNSLQIQNDKGDIVTVNIPDGYFEVIFEDWGFVDSSRVMVPPSYCDQFFIETKQSGYIILNTDYNLDNYINEWGCKR